MSREKTSELISCINTAVSGCSLYSSDHQLVSEYSAKALGLVQDLFVNDAVSFIILGSSLIFNEVPLTDKGININNFIKKLKKKKIEKIVIRKGVDLREFRSFIVAIASADKMASSPNISLGILEVKFGVSELDSAAMMNEGLDKIRGAYGDVSRFKNLDTVSLEDSVMEFIGTLKREINVLSIVSPVKSHSDYTFIHAANVSVLTIFQAEALGLTGDDLHTAGLAGLLHDVGKLFVSSSLLDKQGTLDQKDWNALKDHPVLGAMYLSQIPDIPRLAAIVAFEHHMKFDGTGYPDKVRIGRKQHIVSQMVAIADFFDALRTEKPYRKAFDVPVIAGLVHDGAGRDFNPFLVDNFLSSLKKVSDSF